MMTFGSLFAGIEGFGVGLESAGMQCVWQCERDESCLRVLRRHYPNVPKFTDVREVNATNISIRPDWICGGFPCQDLSVAGRRAGLAGKRSGLFFEFMRIVGELAPCGVLIENVPGLLSSNGGRDMGTVLWELGQRGYGWAYRILDAQYFGLAQRRQRVFIVGCLGDTRRAGEILFESESLPWDSPPGRQEGTRVAACLSSGVAASSGVNRPGRRREDDTNIVSYALNGKNGKRFDGESETLIASALDQQAGGSDDNAAQANHIVPILEVSKRHDPPRVVIPIDMRQASRGEKMTNNRTDGGPPGTGIGEVGDPSPTIAESHPPAIAFYSNESHSSGNNDEISPTLKVGAGLDIPVCPSVCQAQTVRRLTPRECERLQGFPDDWTRYGDDGKEISDSARYRMLGNAVAVPVSEWIGRRIVEANK